MPCLGSLSSNEGEYLIPPASEFTIINANYGPVKDSADVLQLELKPQSPAGGTDAYRR